jgi:hypothetical protein
MVFCREPPSALLVPSGESTGSGAMARGSLSMADRYDFPKTQAMVAVRSVL